MSKGDQLKWQSARFAFERHRDRYPDSPISFSLQLFSLPIATQVFCAKQKRLENRTNMQGGLAQVVERSIRIRQAPGWRPGYSNWLFFTIIFIANFNASFLCQTEKVGEQKKCPRGISSSGRALDSHSRGTGIDTRILQLVFLYNYFRCQLQHKFFVPNRKGWRIEQIVLKQKRLENFRKTEKVGEQKKCPRGISSSGRALDSHSRGTGIDTRILQLVFLYNYFRCQLQHKFFVPNRKGWRIEQICKGDQLKWQSARFAFDRHRDGDPDTPIGYSLQLFSLPIASQVFCAKQKSLENRKNVQGRLAQVVERSIRIREAPGSRHGYSKWLFFTIIFIANFNASLLCQTEKVEEQKQCPRGISSSGRALDSHSRGTGIETRILQLVILYNYFHCQFQRKFVVPNRKVWRKETKYKRDQLKWQSARFAFESHRIDTRILQLVFLYNYFRCQLQHKFFVPNRKGWRIEQICKGDQLKWQSARFAFDRHRDGDPDTPIGYSLQ